MSDLDALLAGIVADPSNAVRWLVMADWLEENGEPERAELVRVHRELLRTCTATRETKARKQFHARMMELMRAGVQPCLPTRTITLPGGVEMRFSFILPGSFLMGSPADEMERQEKEQQHMVTLTKGFWMGQTPVTQRQWAAVMETNPSEFKGEELPVETVSWDDTQAFCATVKQLVGRTLRLPTEAEWEYAARGGTTTPFYWGTESNGTESNCSGDPYGTPVKVPGLYATTKVGSYADRSPHPFGLVDMLGNVCEHCADWFCEFTSCEVTDPLFSECSPGRASRGGCWDFPASGCRSASRGWCKPDIRFLHWGFRLAADLSALA